MTTETRADVGAWRTAVLAGRSGAEDVKGEMYAIPVTRLLVGCIRGMHSSACGGAGPSHPIRGKLWSGCRAF